MSTTRWNAIVVVGHSENQARILAKYANPQDLSIGRSLSKIRGKPASEPLSRSTISALHIVTTVAAHRRGRNRRSDVVLSEIAGIQHDWLKCNVSEGPPTVFTVSQAVDVRGIIADRAAEKTGLRPFLLPEL